MSEKEARVFVSDMISDYLDTQSVEDWTYSYFVNIAAQECPYNGDLVKLVHEELKLFADFLSEEEQKLLNIHA